jgi:hypothetical protein
MVVTQPVLIQSFTDEFYLGDEKYPVTPAIPNSILVEGEVPLDKKKYYMYRKGVGKLIHLSKYTRPDVLNSVRELSRFGANATEAYYKAMSRVLKYCVGTKERGLKLDPNTQRNGKGKNFEFEIKGKADSDFAKDIKLGGVLVSMQHI